MNNTESRTNSLAVLNDVDNARLGIVEGPVGGIANFGTASLKRNYRDWTDNRLNGWKEVLLQFSISGACAIHAKRQTTPL